jgi:hypothetical protein
MHRRDVLAILASLPVLPVGPCDPPPEDAPLLLRTIRRGPLIWTRGDDGTIRVESADPGVEIHDVPWPRLGEGTRRTWLYVRLAGGWTDIAGNVFWRSTVTADYWRIDISCLPNPFALCAFDWTVFRERHEV